MPHDPRTPQERIDDAVLGIIDEEHAARAGRLYGTQEQPRDEAVDTIVEQASPYTGWRDPDPRPDTPDEQAILADGHGGRAYRAALAQESAERRQQERDDRPLTRAEIDEARIAADLSLPLTPQEQAAVHEANREQRAIDDGRAIEQQRERLADQTDRLASMQQTLDQMQRAIGG